MAKILISKKEYNDLLVNQEIETLADKARAKNKDKIFRPKKWKEKISKIKPKIRQAKKAVFKL